MKCFRSGILFTGIVCLVFAGAAAIVHGENLGAALNKQLAQARQGTAKYHDVQNALNDGYVPLGFNDEEGAFEFVNFGLVDCNFDPAHPEGLHYIASGGSMRLVSVEYAVPMACSSGMPAGFGGDQEWEPEGELPIWRLGVSIWSGGPGSVFGE